MSIRALQDYTYYSRYARYNKEQKRRETWSEAVERVKEMHLRKYPQVAEQIEWAFDLVKQKRVLGSQRALQFGGKPIEKKEARLYNCWASHCDRIRFFQECFWLLLCGGGTGFSVQKHHVAKLPDFSKKRANQTKAFQIPDTIEGWSDALGILLGSYMEHPEFSEYLSYDIEFDYSQIRPAGSLLSSGSGRAPGPEPLRKALNIIQELLKDRYSHFDRLRPIDAYDIVMHASDAVLSGGVRRSATIAVFSADDDEMLHAKTGNWFVENPQRGRSNNSALLLRDQTTKEQFDKIIEAVKQYGEPGFFWSDSTEQIGNPCMEIMFWPVLQKLGQLFSGWQPCNLCEINGKKIKSVEDFKIACRGAGIIGTLQAGYTKFDYLGKVSEEIARREALLGVSITGMMDNPDIIFDSDTQREMAQLVLDTNKCMAELIGINPAARATCVKPAGSTSCILGSSSGIHPHHAKRYFRRVQSNSMESVLQHFKESNPLAVEHCVWSASGTDEVITFCCEVPDGAKTKTDVPALDLLDMVKSTQQNWVSAGKRPELCTQPWLSHNVSNTVNVRPNEWQDVADYIYENRKWFAGVSLLPQSGDLDYPQAPFCRVYTPREILQRYGEGAMFASGLIVDGLHAFANNLWEACDVAMGINPLPDEAVDDQKDWVRRVHQFADRYCEGDVRLVTYLMKDVNNWKLWLDLDREYQDVDYTKLIEETDETKPMDTIACSGGKCEVQL